MKPTSPMLAVQRNDLNVHFHAIGDMAIDNCLIAFKNVREMTGKKSIAYFSVSTPEMIEKASKIGSLIVNFIPSCGNLFTAEEVDPLEDRRNFYCHFKEAMDAGITMNFGANSYGTPHVWDPMFMMLIALN